jgi:hypothetical protein
VTAHMFTHVDLNRHLVPPVLYAECFWALETFLGVVQEASEDQLRKCEHILPHQTSTEAVDTAMYTMVSLRTQSASL